ncbi:hypothetical protein B0T25DRAFT_265026 [Lasiosphaeria hispida]|uniref:F-box domain-containing protein n=1 Tax=Lasiosphaeria hispida TaxID=260671 RepID=A0AAJ0HAN6_9PEZI|nr:hypothetical protein B0T25DRAFT_265026 [Lasiosphaeria hispida]
MSFCRIQDEHRINMESTPITRPVREATPEPVIPLAEPALWLKPNGAIMQSTARLTLEPKPAPAVEPAMPTILVSPTAADGEPPAWLRNQRANVDNCWLYQLPTEILLEIRNQTDAATKAVMRSVCSLFLRLIEDLECSKNHWGLPACDHNPETRLSKRQAEEARAILKRYMRGRCNECRTYRISGRYDKTIRQFRKREWCSGCRGNHPLFLFSPHQRALPPSERLCIGREGRLRLCDDQYVTWSGAIRTDSGLLDGRSKSTKVTTYTANARHTKVSDAASMQKGCLPKIKITKVELARSHGTQANNINLHWAIPVLRLDPSTPVTKKQLQTHLTAAKNAFGVSLCPHVEIDDGQLLLPFEPKRCACFDHSTKPGSPPQQSSAPQASCGSCGGQPGSNKKCCRCRSANHQRSFFTPDVNTKDSSNLEHSYLCRTCLAHYSWIRASDCDRYIYLEFRRETSHVDAPARPLWIRLLDPVTWGASADEELRHITWCPDLRCATRVRWTGLEEVLNTLGPSW